MRTRIVLARCTQYRLEDISAALEKLFSALGGLRRYVPAGGSVLIKPNLLTDHRPEKAVTTHPEVVRALIRMVRQCGGNPAVGDSPQGALNTESVLEKTGFRALCEEENVRFIIFEKEPCVMHTYQALSLGVAKAAFDADLIINVPKLKTHIFTLFTNAVKNVFGLLPGFQKMLLHKYCPNPSQFGDCLAFLYSIVRPGLTVCDAITGMEGDGPSAGTPVQLGFLAASADGVALDMALCRMLKININEVPYFEGLRRLGIGESNPDNIDLVGDVEIRQSLRPLRQPRVAGLMRFIPRRLVRIIGPYLWIRPSFTDQCVACNRCIEACPAGALKPGRNNRPRVDGRKCIGCCCCHEVCPECAVRMARSPLLCLAHY